MRDLEARSPLAEHARAQPTLRETPDLRMRETAFSVLSLRVRRDECAREIGARIGAELPLSPNDALKLGEGWIVCTAPNAWRAISPPAGHRDLIAKLADIATDFALVTDLGSAASVIEISGAGARQAIASGCPLDLHARAFKAGSAANSRLVDIPVLVLKTSEEPSFLVVCERFHAHILWDRLADAAEAC